VRLRLRHNCGNEGFVRAERMIAGICAIVGQGRGEPYTVLGTAPPRVRIPRSVRPGRSGNDRRARNI
jgi:hypothetical protein